MGTTLFTGGKPPDDKPQDTKPPESPVTVYRYRCVRACTFDKRYRKEGDIVELSEKRDIPHFVPVM